MSVSNLKCRSSLHFHWWWNSQHISSSAFHTESQLYLSMITNLHFLSCHAQVLHYLIHSPQATIYFSDPSETSFPLSMDHPHQKFRTIHTEQSVVTHNWYNQKSIFSTFLWEEDPNLWMPELAPFGCTWCVQHTPGCWLWNSRHITALGKAAPCELTDAKITCTSPPMNSSDWRFSTSSADSWF